MKILSNKRYKELLDYESKYRLLYVQLSKEIDIWNKKYNDMFDKNKHLDEVNCKLRRKIGQLEDNWIKLRKWIVYNKHNENTEQHYLVVDYGTLLGKMRELKQGSDK
jgi:hypothetical protein